MKREASYNNLSRARLGITKQAVKGKRSEFCFIVSLAAAFIIRRSSAEPLPRAHRQLRRIYCAPLDICFVQHAGNNAQALGISHSHFWNWFHSSFSPELTHYFAALFL